MADADAAAAPFDAVGWIIGDAAFGLQREFGTPPRTASENETCGGGVARTEERGDTAFSTEDLEAVASKLSAEVERLSEVGNDDSGGWCSNKDALEHLGVDPRTLRAARVLSDELRLRRPWARIGGSDHSPRFRWNRAQLDAWWVELHEAHEKAERARRVAEATRRRASRGRTRPLGEKSWQ